MRVVIQEILKQEFLDADLDHSGQLEITEAKAIFDRHKIHFETADELNNYFYDNLMSFGDFCDLLINKKVVDEKLAQNATLQWVTLDLKLNPSFWVNKEEFHIRQKAVNWIRKFLNSTNVRHEPYPVPPGQIFKNGHEISIAMDTIVQYTIATKGRTDNVTYENAFLSLEEADKAQVVCWCKFLYFNTNLHLCLFVVASCC
jgi:hypothetical protein